MRLLLFFSAVALILAVSSIGFGRQIFEGTKHANARQLQSDRLPITESLWVFISGGCFLRGFFQESRRYSDMVARSQYTNVRWTGEEALANMRINNVGPLMLRGLFWLNLAGTWTEALSFAPTEEGGGLSEGTFSPDNDPAYRIRLMGDGTWAGGRSPEFLSVLTDPVSTFVVEKGTTENPETLRVFIDFVFPFSCTRFSSDAGCLTPVLNWTMTLQNTPANVIDGRDPHPDYSSSIVWRRDTEGVMRFSYEAIQVADGDGNLLSPASEAFILDVNEQTDQGSLLAGVLNPDASRLTFCSSGSWWCFWC